MLAQKYVLEQKRKPFGVKHTTIHLYISPLYDSKTVIFGPQKWTC